MRVLCHAQHLTGIGHFVRIRALARGLVSGHEVHLVDGGRTIASAPGAGDPHPVLLPRVGRSRGRLIALDGAADAVAILAERARLLAEAVRQIRPDVLLVDHYPFSKWELEGEISAAIDAARSCQPRVRVLCSLRDVAPQTRHEAVDPDAYESRVLEVLDRSFDGLLVHSDPAFTTLAEHFGRADQLPIPVHYTGFVCAAAALSQERAVEDDSGHVVLSCGGAAAGMPFLAAAIEAFRRLVANGELAGRRLIVCAPAFATDDERAVLAASVGGLAGEVCRFAPGFEDRLSSASLSISRAGYNTCTAVLLTRCRSVLVPDPAMSDQFFRAHRLAELGLATVADDSTGVESLVSAIREALRGPRPRHRLALDGVACTRELIEAGR